MYLNDITESNQSNILNWALMNKANIIGDISLIDLINDEMKYLITIEDVNFLELYELTQMYRDHLKILYQSPVQIPSTEQLKDLFGLVAKDTDLKPYELASNAIRRYCDLVTQIEGNKEEGNRVSKDTPLDILFVPMISRHYTIQIPLRFIDFIYLLSEQEYRNTFKISTYPYSLEELLKENKDPKSFRNKLLIQLIKNSIPAQYNPRFIKYLDITKFNSLKKKNDDEQFYSPTLLNFGFEDPLTKRIIRYSFFKSKSDDLKIVLKKMRKYHINKMMYEFAIQLPLEYMQILENHFNNGMVEIKYRLPLESIISKGFNYKQIIKIRDLDQNVTEVVDAYGVRLHEAAIDNVTNINMLIKLLKDEKAELNYGAIYSLLPAIYSVQAVIKISSENISEIINISHPMIKSIFTDIQHQINLLNDDISNI